MSFQPPETFNIAHYLLDARIEEGRGGRPAVRTGDAVYTYAEVLERANRIGSLLRELGVHPEQRVVIALPDGIDFVATLFGALKIGAVGVMVNRQLGEEELRYFLDYTRARAAVVHREDRERLAGASRGSDYPGSLVVLDEPAVVGRLEAASGSLHPFPTHRDDAALWLFSGGTTGRPKGVVQSHRSFANTTELYGKAVLGLTEKDVTISVPKLFFGYATGSNLFFPFSVGASCVLFPERCEADVLFEQIAHHRPTVLVTVPTMISRMVAHPRAPSQDLGSLRLATSAGEALPVEVHERWTRTFGVELLDGLGTAEMWHVFLTNRPGHVRPGTLGTAVPGFQIRLCDEEGEEVPVGEVGRMWVRGDSRAIGYWHHGDEDREAFRGEWYVSGDMLSRDAEGYYTYHGRADDLLKVSGKWLSPQEVENCLLQHPSVREAVVVGVRTPQGLTKPHAFVIASAPTGELALELQDFVRSRLAPYKSPRKIVFVDDLPRTHLGKVDRGKLRSE